jgi:membrane associated rhomboid family serine protease
MFYSLISISSWIIVLNVFFYFFISILKNVNPDYLNYFILTPIDIAHGQYLSAIVLHMFSHVYLLHILLNMFALASFGGLCEKIIGRKRFLWFYLAAGLFAGILSVVSSLLFGYGFGERIVGSPEIGMLGASGAIFGVAGLIMMILPRLKFSIIFLPMYSFPAYKILPVLLALMWIISIIFGALIGNVAHFGGFIVGVGYGYFLRRKYKNKIIMLQRYFR